MANYFLTKKAVEDLSKIWNYTFDTWSEYQADKYYLALVEDCQMLADKSHLGRNYPEINSAIYGYKSGEHIIFYRKLIEGNIEVVRFLHSKMDLKSRIQE
jgi:toxin ParE1/3/4